MVTGENRRAATIKVVSTGSAAGCRSQADIDRRGGNPRWGILLLGSPGPPVSVLLPGGSNRALAL